MKIIKLVSMALFFLFLSACATHKKFPVSNTVPAADIAVTKKKDKNNNYVIEVTAKNLADAKRLNPSKNNYSVWIVVENGSTKNIGQLTNKNSKTSTLKTVTPFNVVEIFITAENQGDLNEPAGTEISRTSF